ncbi:Low molecular weight protein tyrosine phosphatase [Limosilactobacillus reuteri]|uniref:protein-tyrosine-phosphatase n=1 Tax=Limosilactobacillus reuteri TaxID=1598 RepID=A0A0U5JT67_LIMRT|nr:low molecular weight protein-tyrosine-phosphatase [Limosilactobacillus reuteri]CUR41074.1 Low molecular weight protein tyrosine phosphatase [Limosilactobacillus reuteri]
MKVIFVCLGNICRSPMAEAMFKKMVAEAGLADQITIDLAGTSNIAKGSPADSRTKAILDKYHIKDDGMIARQLRDRDYYDTDYIIAMDQMKVRDAKDMALAGLENKVHRIFEATPGKENRYIVDPWITHRFQDTYDSLSEALPNWLAKLKKEIK